MFTFFERSASSVIVVLKFQFKTLNISNEQLDSIITVNHKIEIKKEQ